MVCIVFPIIYAYRENMDHKEIVLLSYFKTLYINKTQIPTCKSFRHYHHLKICWRGRNALNRAAYELKEYLTLTLES